MVSGGQAVGVMMRPRAFIDVPLDWLADVGERHIPRLLVISMGVVGIVAGVFFVLLPDGALGGAWHFLTSGAPSVFWGILFLVVGGGLTAAGLIEHTKSALLCFLESLIFFGLAIAALSSLTSWGTRAIFFVCLVFGWVCIVGLLASLAPEARKALRHE